MLLEKNWLNGEAKRLVKKYWNLERSPTVVVDNLTEEEWLHNSKGTKGEIENVVAMYNHNTNIIEFNSKRNKDKNLHEIRLILKHELCHWYNHIQGKPFYDSDVEFALELIKIRAAITCNEDEDAINAMKKAKKIHKKQRQNNVFVLRYNLEDYFIYLHHPRKTEQQFIQDIKKALIELHQTKEQGESIDIADVAKKMCALFNYKEMKNYVTSSFTFYSNSYGDINIEESLYDLGMEIEEVETVIRKED